MAALPAPADDDRDEIELELIALIEDHGSERTALRRGYKSEKETQARTSLFKFTYKCLVEISQKNTNPKSESYQ